MVKSAYMVWLQFHDLPEGHRKCLRCAGKTLPHAGRAWEHIASYPHAAANLQGLLERIRLGPTEESPPTSASRHQELFVFLCCMEKAKNGLRGERKKRKAVPCL